MSTLKVSVIEPFVAVTVAKPPMKLAVKTVDVLGVGLQLPRVSGATVQSASTAPTQMGTPVSLYP